jgi:lipopolysaccharide biosynthesis protein
MTIAASGSLQSSKKRARMIAFYLPQFHPIPENDKWWGRGFTEWANVSRAQPLFSNHYQPHIPADLGFYDLRLAESRIAQAELAAQFGIEGFCYWHYWFKGRRLLERPFNEVLSTGQPKLPFCLAWANETWSRRWLGEEKDILMAQEYSPEDDVNHTHWLATAFSDPRYIRVNGRPLFLIYRPLHLPNPKQTTETMREVCIKHGLTEPYLVGVNAHCPDADARTAGFDGTLNFEPQLGYLPDFMSDKMTLSKLVRNVSAGIRSPRLKIYDYSAARRLMLRWKKSFPTYPCIFVGWDNTPRRGRNGIIVINSTPERFGSGLKEIVQSVLDKPQEDRLIFINAWNEWAEGNHLEPDFKHGLAYLEAIRKACEAGPMAV